MTDVERSNSLTDLAARIKAEQQRLQLVSRIFGWWYSQPIELAVGLWPRVKPLLHRVSPWHEPCVITNSDDYIGRRKFSIASVVEVIAERRVEFLVHRNAGKSVAAQSCCRNSSRGIRFAFTSFILNGSKKNIAHTHNYRSVVQWDKACVLNLKWRG